MGTARENISAIMAVKPDGSGTDIRSNDKMGKGKTVSLIKSTFITTNTDR